MSLPSISATARRRIATSCSKDPFGRHERLRRADDLGGDREALEHLVGIGPDEVTVLERARLAVDSVAHDVPRRTGVVPDRLPLLPGREPRAAAAPKTGSRQFLDHRVRREFEDLGQGGAPTARDVFVERRQAFVREEHGDLTTLHGTIRLLVEHPGRPPQRREGGTR